MKNTITLFVIISLFVIINNVNADVDMYVNQNTGANTITCGSNANPCLSISYAVINVFQVNNPLTGPTYPRLNLYLAQGIYLNDTEFPTNLAGYNITIQPIPGNTVSFKGFRLFLNYITGIDELISYLEITGINVEHPLGTSFLASYSYDTSKIQTFDIVIRNCTFQNTIIGNYNIFNIGRTTQDKQSILIDQCLFTKCSSNSSVIPLEFFMWIRIDTTITNSDFIDNSAPMLTIGNGVDKFVSIGNRFMNNFNGFNGIGGHSYLLMDVDRVNSAKIQDTIFENNNVGASGNLIQIFQGQNIIISNFQFKNNSGNFEFLFNVDVTIDNSEFSNNFIDGNYYYTRGSAIFFLYVDNLVISNTLFGNNSMSKSEKPQDTVAMFSANTTQVHLQNVTFLNNQGGGYSSLDITHTTISTNSKFVNNHVAIYCGADLLFPDDTVTFTNNLVNVQLNPNGFDAKTEQGILCVSNSSNCFAIGGPFAGQINSTCITNDDSSISLGVSLNNFNVQFLLLLLLSLSLMIIN